MKLKKPVPILLMAAVAILISAVLIKSAQSQYHVAIAFQQNGLQSFKCNGVEFLDNGEFRVHQVTLKKPDGSLSEGTTAGAVRVDPDHQEVTQTYLWGVIKIHYAAAGNQLAMTIDTFNTSDTDTIQGLHYEPLTVKFPDKVAEYDGTIPLLAHNVGDVAVVKASYGSSALTIMSEDVEKPLMIGLPWANNRPHNTVFPLSVHTGRVKNYPDSYPEIVRPIAPKSSDEYHVTLRFGRASASQSEVASDVYQKFASAFPQTLQWTDHRPIGVVFLANATDSPFAKNPRGWFAEQSLDVTTPVGRAAFRQDLLHRADSAISIMKDMHAQGAITWDIEGQEFEREVSYVGDPRLVGQLAPEMNDVIDEYFQHFHNAGLRVGILVRPQRFTVSEDKTGKRIAVQEPVDDPASLLIDKIRYAKNRWGVTLVYIDSNTNLKDSNPLDAAVVQRVASTFPDVLLIPEHWNLRYFAFSAPYGELRQGHISTPELVRTSYPKAFSVIYTADGPLDLYHKKLAAAVKHGDSLMYRTWYADPQNEKVKNLLNP